MLCNNELSTQQDQEEEMHLYSTKALSNTP